MFFGVLVSCLGILKMHKQIKKQKNVDNMTVIYVGFIFIAKSVMLITLLTFCLTNVCFTHLLHELPASHAMSPYE